MDSTMVFGVSLDDIETFAQAMDHVWPAPAGVNVDVSAVLAWFADGDVKILQKLRSAMLSGNIDGFINVFETVESEKFSAADVQKLRASFDSKSFDDLSIALRRVAGDWQAGTAQDPFEKFVGKYVKEDQITGALSRIPFLEEQHPGSECAKPVDPRKHFGYPNAWHDARCGSFLSKPAIYPQLEPDEAHRHKTRMFTVMQIEEASEDWIKTSQLSVIHLNIANGAADHLMAIEGAEGFHAMVQDPLKGQGF
jgi:hypothetical protein